MRYDVEIACSELFQKYLSAMCSTGVGEVMDALACPIVTFFDPMSVDDADRLIVMSPDTQIDPNHGGTFTAEIDVGLKTLWHQSTIKEDFCLHFLRVNDVRDKLMPVDLLARLAPYVPDGIAIDFVEHRKAFETHIAQTTKANWNFSGTKFGIVGHFLRGV